jgi:hypothetical protein
MPSFGSIYARMLCEQEGGPPLLAADTADEDDAVAVDAFRRGMHLRSDKEPDATFWNELKRMACENRKGLAKLLQVSPSVIGRWPAVIENYLKKVGELDAHADVLKKPQVIPTGGDTKAPVGNRPVIGMQGAFGDTNVPAHQGPF